MRMHCFCKSISSSSSSYGVPIASNVYFVCRAMGVPMLLPPHQGASFLHTHSSRLPLYSSRQVFCFTELNPSYPRPGFLPFFPDKITHHCFSSSRSLQGSPKRNTLKNPNSNPAPRSSPKKTKVHAGKDSQANARSSAKPVQAQKKSSPKEKQVEAKPVLAKAKSSSQSLQGKAPSASKPGQAKAKSSPQSVQGKAPSASKSGQAKAASSSKQAAKKAVVDEEEDTEEDEDFEENFDEDEDFDDDEEDFDDELIDDADSADDDFQDKDAAFIDDMLDEEGEGVEDIVLGDGGDGGGINISQTAWGEKALSVAQGVLQEFGSNFSLYAFKTSFENRIYVRLDKHSDRYGSPTMVEIESFSKIFGKRLEEAGQDGLVPDNIAVEVSSPGAERVVLVPDQLLRFKDLPMLVRYEDAPTNENTKSSPLVKDSILQFASLDTASEKSMWKLANVRANREQAGKGRSLTKKQKEWTAEIPLSSLRLVRLYMDI